MKLAARQAAVLVAAALGTGAGLGLTGCGSEEPSRQLTADAFVRNRPSRDVGNPVDNPGPLVYDTARGGEGTTPEASSPPPVRAIGATVREGVRSPTTQAGRPDNPGSLQAVTVPPAIALPPAGQAASAPQIPPATGPASGPGNWVDVGAVLMEVNGRPIFTDKVLTAIEAPLAAEAKKRNEASFRELAKALLDNQIRLYVRDELEYASAERSMDEQDKALARALTMQWRQKRITEAGGSLEVARRRAVEEQGIDFDEMIERQNRLHLIQIFYQKRVIPLIQVAAADIREYYNAHKDTEFTKHGAARFRVIKIDPRKYRGVREEAFAKAEQIRRRTAAEDFTALASDPKVNDDPGLAANGGYVVKDGWVDQGAYAVADVDKAVFQMHPGQVSDILPTDGAFFIVKLEDLKEGGVQPFDDMQVQDRIREKLRAEQFQALRDKHVTELEKDAITRHNDGAIRNALGIIMRRYSQWASAQ